MIRIVDSAMTAHPGMEPTSFVDNLGTGVVGGPRWVRRRLVGFVLHVCRLVARLGMEISATKSVSSTELGEGIRDDLKEFGIKLVQEAKSLVVAGSWGPPAQHRSEQPSQAVQAETLPVRVATTQRC